MALPRIGGSFAPPLPPEKVAAYRTLAERAPPHIKEAMLTLCNMVERLHEGPSTAEVPSEPAQPATPHATNLALIVPLAPAEVARLDPHVPWKHELEAYATIFDTLDSGGQRDIRNAAFHLLWFGHELFMDREPLTSDRLQSRTVQTVPSLPVPAPKKTPAKRTRG